MNYYFILDKNGSTYVHIEGETRRQFSVKRGIMSLRTIVTTVQTTVDTTKC